MGSQLPKQFLELKGRPLLMHTMDVFVRYPEPCEIILVLSREHVITWKELCQKHRFTPDHLVVTGGPARGHSVRNGLARVDRNALVAVHDGVRPLVSHETISRCFAMAAKKGSAVPCLSSGESVRLVQGNENIPLERERVKLIQTPQIFQSTLLKEAYEKGFREDCTDDAGIYESQGHTIWLAEGNRENIKITGRNDLLFAETLL